MKSNNAQNTVAHLLASCVEDSEHLRNPHKVSMSIECRRHIAAAADGGPDGYSPVLLSRCSRRLLHRGMGADLDRRSIGSARAGLPSSSQPHHCSQRHAVTEARKIQVGFAGCEKWRLSVIAMGAVSFRCDGQFHSQTAHPASCQPVHLDAPDRAACSVANCGCGRGLALPASDPDRSLACSPRPPPRFSSALEPCQPQVDTARPPPAIASPRIVDSVRPRPPASPAHSLHGARRAAPGALAPAASALPERRPMRP
ncbi:hypothetical protein SVAN01_03541 [Stagonosporopsis vannaccii]|nr:hypothetical protein SVAN01_03541 [Stagonosporopsis vannaccii]